MTPTSLRISLYFEVQDGVPHAPEGPGWYLAAIRTNQGSVGEIIPRVRLSNDEAVKLCKVFDNFANGKPMNWATSEGAVREDISVEQAAIEANAAGKEAIRQQLADAEQAVRRLDALRRRAQEFGSEDES